MSIVSTRRSIDSSNNKRYQPTARLSRVVNVSVFDCSLINYGKMRFLICAAPKPSSMQIFQTTLRENNVMHLVRDLPFEDGKMPTEDIIKSWLDLVSSVFRENQHSCIGVHCKAGLGRAPVLVAIALMECGMSFSDAILLIRSHRKAAFNTYQVEMLSHYKASRQLRHMNNERCTLL